ncbi:MAG TPA: transaldolase [Actinomycetaceae bacterium]|nr:transaldolase [Actinomycetaceae bacterium]
MSENLKQLSDAGVSIWLDDLSRGAIASGKLAEDIANRSVVGVTTNPTIFANALSKGADYAEQMGELAAKNTSLDDAVVAATTDDVRNACDILRPIYDATGQDGRVSIEVDPRLARETEVTIEQARMLWETVNRPNCLIKIPATVEGLPAITTVVSEGISVNVTLIFSIDRYRAVADAYIDGLEKAHANGIDISGIHSVASFFISRIDTEVDKRLEAIGTPEALALRGKAAVANGRLAYEAYEEIFSSERFNALPGANKQRVLWASTGVKNPDYPDTMYVADLVTENVVNTMPEATLLASADHLEVKGDTVSTMYEDAHKVMDDLAAVGVDFADVAQLLEDEGVVKFEQSWEELLESVTTALNG